MNKGLLFASLLCAACSSGKTEPNDDFSGIADEKSDSFSSRMKIVGTLADATGDVQFDYKAQPIYRAVKLHAEAGDWVKVTVSQVPSSTVKVKNPPPSDGDPVTYLLDSKFKTVAKNDDANDNTHDSHIVTELKKTGTYYVVVRDYNYGSYPFDAQLSLARASGDPVADANSWFQFFFMDDYGSPADKFSIPMARMPKAAEDDATGYFQSDVGNATGYKLPYDGDVMYMLVGTADEAYDVRPYDSAGNPIADTALGGDATDIWFGPKPPRGTK
jgi:hypothetical protein